MKKLFLTASLLVTSFLTYAQTSKGQGIWTGSVSFGYNSQKNKSGFGDYSNQTSTNGLSFTRGAFFKDNWLLGIGLNAGLGVNNFRGMGVDRPEYIKSTQYGLGLNGFVRRYWGQERWRVFLGGGLSLAYNRTNIESSVNTQSPDANSFALAPVLQVGANYYLTDRIGLEATASSTSFPVTFSSVGIGLVILTGVQGTHPNATHEAPQTAKGCWILGGSFGLTTEAEKANLPVAERIKETAFSLSPSVGWFVAKNLLLGVSVPLSWSKTENDSTFLYGIRPYLKKYISDNRLRPFVGGNLSYFAIRNKANGASSTNQQIGLAVNAGLAYLLGERFIVEAGLGSVSFNKPIYPENLSIKSWNGGLSVTLQPGFTIQYVFD